MLLKFFRSSYLIHYFTLFILALILWGGAIIHPVDVVPSSDVYPFYSIIYFWFGENKLVFSLMGFILLFFETLLINNIITENDIVPRSSLIPGFLYVILMSFSPELLTLHPVLISNLFLILILKLVFKIYGQKEPYRFLYKFGFLLGVASFFYLPVYSFMLYAFIVLFVLRFLNWREFVIPVVGFLTLYFFLAVWYFWLEQFDWVFNCYQRFFQSIDFVIFEFDILTIIISLIFILLFVLSMLYLVGGKYYEKVISIRKKLKLSFFFLIISSITIILYGGSMIHSLIVLGIPLTIFISFYFCELKKIFLLNILTILLILLMMINNYHLLEILI